MLRDLRSFVVIIVTRALRVFRARTYFIYNLVYSDKNNKNTAVAAEAVGLS